MFVTDVGANIVVVVSRADAIEEAAGIKAARVGDVASSDVLIVVVTSEATEEAIEPKVRVSNRKAMAHCDFHPILKFLCFTGKTEVLNDPP